MGHRFLVNDKTFQRWEFLVFVMGLSVSEGSLVAHYKSVKCDAEFSAQITLDLLPNVVQTLVARSDMTN